MYSCLLLLLSSFFFAYFLEKHPKNKSSSAYVYTYYCTVLYIHIFADTRTLPKGARVQITHARTDLIHRAKFVLESMNTRVDRGTCCGEQFDILPAVASTVLSSGVK